MMSHASPQVLAIMTPFFWIIKRLGLMRVAPGAWAWSGRRKSEHPARPAAHFLCLPAIWLVVQANSALPYPALPCAAEVEAEGLDISLHGGSAYPHDHSTTKSLDSPTSMAMPGAVLPLPFLPSSSFSIRRPKG